MMENGEQEHVLGVQRMQQYISVHLMEPITLYALAGAAGYSPWHSARIFKEQTGKTPFEYIRVLRLSKAALRLRDEQVRVLDVALDFVFDSHEGFTKAFSREFGLTPKHYMKSTPPIQLFMPYPVRGRSLTNATDRKGESTMSTNANTIFVQVIDRPARKLIIKRGIKATEYFEYCSEVGCDIWGLLTSVKEALYEPIGMWLPKHLQPEGTSHYAQGVEVAADYAGIVPEGCELLELPPCKMMVFQGQPYDDEQYGEAIGRVWEAVKSYDPTVYGYKWADEDAPRFQLAPMGYRGYIEARPVRAING